MGLADWTEQERLDVLEFFRIDTLNPDQWVAEANDAPQSPVEEEAGTIPLVPCTTAQLFGEQDNLAMTRLLVLQDVSDPLGINDEEYIQQVRLKDNLQQTEAEEKKRSVSILSPNFHPRHFIRSVHHATSFVQLIDGMIHLQQSTEQRNETLKAIVKQNFGRFINAKNSVEAVYQDMKQRGLTTDDHGLAATGQALQAAFQKAQEVFQPLLARRSQEEVIRKRLRVYEKYSFILSLGGNFERYIALGDYQQASYDYRKAKALLSEVNEKSALRKVLDKTWNGLFAKVLGQLRAELYAKLANPIFPYDVHAKMIEYLMELDAQPDPVNFYFESVKKFLLGQVKVCRERAISELASIMAKEAGSSQDAFERLIDLGKAHEIDAILASDNIYGHCWRIRKGFFLNITELFFAFAPSFSKFTTAIFEGKFGAGGDGSAKAEGDHTAMYIGRLRDFCSELSHELISSCEHVLAEVQFEHSSAACAFTPLCLHTLLQVYQAAEDASMSDIMIDSLREVINRVTVSMVAKVWKEAQADAARLPSVDSWVMGAEGLDLSTVLIESFQGIVSQMISTQSSLHRSFGEQFPDGAVPFPDVIEIVSGGMSSLFVSFIDALKSMALAGDPDSMPLEDATEELGHMDERMNLDHMGIGYKLLIILTNILHMQQQTVIQTGALFVDAGLGDIATECHMKVSEHLGLAYYHISDLYLSRRRGHLLSLIQEGFDSFYWKTDKAPGQTRPYIDRVLAEVIVIQNEILDVSPVILRTLMTTVARAIFKEFLAGVMNLNQRISQEAYAQLKFELDFISRILVTAISQETEELLQEVFRQLQGLSGSRLAESAEPFLADRLNVLIEQTSLQYCCFQYT